MAESKLRRFLLCAASAAAAAGLVYVALHRLLWWLAPFLLAAAFAAALEPAVRYLQTRFRFRRGFAALVLTLFTLFVLGGLLSLLGTALLREARALLDGVPGMLAQAPDALASLLARVNRYTAACPPWLRESLTELLTRYIAEASGLMQKLTARLLSALASGAAKLPAFFFAAATAVLALYFTLASLPELRALLRGSCPAPLLAKLSRLRGGMARSVSHWLRAELALCALTFCEVLSGLLLLRRPYALLLAVLITLVDALPVFGTGTVLVPWAAFHLLMGRAPLAAALAALYLVTLTVRSVMEPRLLGAKAGLPPILSLLAMYLGFCAFGVGGMVLFPFLLLLAAQLRR